LNNRPLKSVFVMASTDSMSSLKLVAVGDGAVGKTCLLLKYVDGKYEETHIPTIFDNKAKRVTLDGQVITLTLWDTAGQEDYARLRPLSYPNTDVFLICFSMTSRTSLNNIQQKWIPELMQYHKSHPTETNNKVPKFILVGNKQDLWETLPESSDKISVAEIQKFMKDTQSEQIKGFKMCSAKTGDNVEDVFSYCCRVGLGTLKEDKPRNTTKGGCAIL